jgi:cytokinin dehydrogenase
MKSLVPRHQTTEPGAVATGSTRSGSDGCVPPSLADIRRLGIEIRTDSASCDRAGSDFGKVVRRPPLAVAIPRSADDIATIVRVARAHGTKIAARGSGYSNFGQAQVEGGLVIDMRSLNGVLSVESDRVTVEAGARWSDVLSATAAHGLMPPVLTSHLGVTVGGTLSYGGISRQSCRFGLQIDNVIALDVVTGTGEIVSCSASRDAELFEATLGGLGQCGIVARATLRLVPMPARARIFRLVYDDLPTARRDQCILLERAQVSSILGIAVPSEVAGRRHYLIEASSFYSLPDEPDAAGLLEGLSYGAVQVEDRDFMAFVDDKEFYAQMEAAGVWELAHPWVTTLVPASTFLECADEIFAMLPPEEIGRNIYFLFGPMRSTLFRRRLTRVPDEETFFVIDVAPFVPREPELIRAALERNRRILDRVRESGGVLFPVSAVASSPAEWQTHFGDVWDWFVDAKRRFDPDRVLSPDRLEQNRAHS